MNSYHDPELDDVLQDGELRHIASMLRSARRAEPPLDEAFQSGLRRQLMNQAWSMSEGREAWWRRIFAPATFAWAGAAAGLVLIASLVLWNAVQPSTGGLDQIVIHTPIDGSNNVALQQPILVSFNQPMDHPSTEAAVTITPATTVTFSWRQNTLAVQPTGGNLAPNTQYQVTIGPSAKTASGKTLSAPKTIRFVTQAPSSPAPSPTPRPTPQNPLNAHQLVSLGGATGANVLWSADSTSVYVIDGGGALRSIPAGGGTATVIAPDGVTSEALTPDGGLLAYIRGGKIEILDLASGKSSEVGATPAPVVVGWSGGSVVWAAADGFYTNQPDTGSRQLAPLPTSGTVAVVSIAPDGAHAVYTQDQNLFLIDLSNGKSVQLGQTGATFEAWSPISPEVVYDGGQNLVVSDFTGATEATLPAGDATWSSDDAILVGSDTVLVQARPDGSNQTRIANGSFHSPRWAPDGATFTFVRGGALWIATAPALPAEPTAVADAAKVVDSFMQARLKGDADGASQYLDANGKQAYTTNGLSLTIGGGSTFSRYYMLTQEQTATEPDTVRDVVRLVLSQSNVDVSDFEETLTLVRDATTKQFLIDTASAGAHRNLGKGPEVVSVDVEPTTVKVTFDSDLDAQTAGSGVQLVDGDGNAVQADVSYANRMITLSGLHLKQGAQYTLVVQTSVHDVNGQPVSAEYDLGVVGPAAKLHGNRGDVAPSGPGPIAPAASTPAATAG